MLVKKRHLVVLVEDNPGDVRLMQEAFGEVTEQVDILPLLDGEQGKRYFEQLLVDTDLVFPDLIILDLNIPKVHGTELLALIKRSERLRVVPLIVLSTSDSADDIRKSYELHANCYIIKPVDVGRFFDIVQTIDMFWLKTVILPVVQ